MKLKGKRGTMLIAVLAIVAALGIAPAAGAKLKRPVGHVGHVAGSDASWAGPDASWAEGQ